MTDIRKWLETKSGQKDGLEQKSIVLEIKASDEETNVIEGYASTFGGDPDHVGDIVAQGAFTKTIQTRGNQVKMLVNHRWSDIIGKVVELKEDNYGLFFKAKISETARGNEIMTLIKDGVLDRISIGYRTIKSKWDHENNIRTLEEVELYELSVVPIPANDRAVITGAKNDEPSPEEKAGRVLSKKTETALREAKSALESALKEVDELLSVVDEPDEGKGSKPEPEPTPPKPEPTEEEKRLAAEEVERKKREAEEQKQARILEALEKFKLE